MLADRESRRPDPPAAAGLAGHSGHPSPASRAGTGPVLPMLAAGAFLGLVLLGFVIFTYPVGSQGMGVGSPIYQICLLSAFALTVAAVRPWADPRRLAALPVGLIILFGWCWLSVGWAISPESAIRRVVQATVIALSAFYILGSLGYDRFMALLRRAFIVQLLLCYLAVFLVPMIGIQHAVVLTDAGDAGAWKGIMMDKNTAGAFCMMTIIVFLFDAGEFRPWVRALVIAAAAVFLINAASKAAIGIALPVLAIAGLVRVYNPLYRGLLVPLVMIVAALLALNQDWLFAPFRNAIYEPLSFTGRGMIWAALWAYIEDHWLLGAGFGSFWSIGPASPVNRYSDYAWVRETVYVGHNGYLDLWATIGLPGLVMAVAVIVLLPLARVVIARDAPRGPAAIAAAIILFCAGNNVTESTMLNGDAFLNVMLMFALAILYVRQPKAAPAGRDAGSAPADRRGEAR